MRGTQTNRYRPTVRRAQAVTPVDLVEMIETLAEPAPFAAERRAEQEAVLARLAGEDAAESPAGATGDVSSAASTTPSPTPLHISAFSDSLHLADEHLADEGTPDMEYVARELSPRAIEVIDAAAREDAGYLTIEDGNYDPWAVARDLYEITAACDLPSEVYLEALTVSDNVRRDVAWERYSLILMAEITWRRTGASTWKEAA